MATCRICNRDGIREWLDFGPQALTNRFLRSRDEAEYLHPCKLGVCRGCGTLQLESPVPVAEMRPRFDWITYNEPERHLDEVARVLTELPGVSTTSTIPGWSGDGCSPSSSGRSCSCSWEPGRGLSTRRVTVRSAARQRSRRPV